jgi:hypothetical protein
MVAWFAWGGYICPSVMSFRCWVFDSFMLALMGGSLCLSGDRRVSGFDFDRPDGSTVEVPPLVRLVTVSPASPNTPLSYSVFFFGFCPLLISTHAVIHVPEILSVTHRFR